MAFHPDIVVTTPDGMMLVAEAKVTLPDLAHTEEDLKKYMFGMQCPVGLLITPQRMWLYQDSYTARSPDSVKRVAEFDLKPLWDQPPVKGMPFDAFVQHWLEELAAQPTRGLPAEMREAFREYVLPAITNGELRAAHPRYS